ncbi:MAG: hypothetical protein DMG02_31225 [Acidobacteria bacterium]|nr:MAG: hypothetical protein DMG03_22285 [Acidobacteriota bacterium]PYQ84377.1 MAG: hypothetical protein DMG02_31225 [Acidobacteriota bacterium]PYR06166.1 MAG: hypothetical protein DMF99_26605 [Acidobacteriota bacterium]
MLLRSKLDRVYEDRLSHAISGELWTMHSGELPRNLGECEPKWSVVRREFVERNRASIRDFGVAGFRTERA